MPCNGTAVAISVENLKMIGRYATVVKRNSRTVEQIVNDVLTAWGEDTANLAVSMMYRRNTQLARRAASPNVIPFEPAPTVTDDDPIINTFTGRRAAGG